MLTSNSTSLNVKRRLDNFNHSSEMPGHQHNHWAQHPFAPSPSPATPRTTASQAGSSRTGGQQTAAPQPFNPATPRPAASQASTQRTGTPQTGAQRGGTQQRGTRRAADPHTTTSKATTPRNATINTSSPRTAAFPVVATAGTGPGSVRPANSLPPTGPRSTPSSPTSNVQVQAHPLSSSQNLQRSAMSRQEDSVPARASNKTLVATKDIQGATDMAEASSEKEEEEECEDEVLLHQFIRSGNMVKIYVGADKHCWVLHEDALCHYSEYFKKAFQGNFAEADQKFLSLEEDDSITFGHFVDWIYTGSVECTLHHKKSHKNQSKEHFLLYVRLEIFADKYLLHELSECAVAEWEKCHTQDGHVTPFLDEVKLIYEDCPEKSKFRLLVVLLVLIYYLTGRGQDYAYMGQVLSCNASFAEKFAKELKDHQELENPTRCWIDGCSLHPEATASKSDSASKRQRVN